MFSAHIDKTRDSCNAKTVLGELREILTQDHKILEFGKI